VQKIADTANELSAELIVVGYPKNMDGSIGSRAQECMEIGKKIGEATKKEIIMWDERCTTISAHTALNYTDTKGKKRKQVVDAVAAVIILEDYLNFRKNHK
jgi:putative Holliday junction resolvase